jgi:hypothetical protein
MKKEDLELTAPQYNDQVVVEMKGDYNDGDYTYDSTKMSLEAYAIVMPILIECSGSHNWESKDREELGIEALEKLGIVEGDELFDDVLGTLEDISLYSDWGECHSMYIQAVYFESKSDNIRYVVKWN